MDNLSKQEKWRAFVRDGLVQSVLIFIMLIGFFLMIWGISEGGLNNG